jgi:DNA (cytosine-5)-methyltransferase 1
MLECIALFRPTYVIAENVKGLVTWNDGLVLETVCVDLEKEGYEVQPFVIPAVAVGAPHRRERVWVVAHNVGQQEYATTTKRPHPKLSEQTVDASNAGSERAGLPQRPSERQGSRHQRHAPWDENWLEVATRLCIVDDGLPNGLVRPKGWRNAALKAAGNAIVPQVAIEIMEAIRNPH